MLFAKPERKTNLSRYKSHIQDQ